MNEYEIVLRDMLFMLGLEVRPDGRIADTDSGVYLVFDGGYLYTENGPNAIRHRKDVSFDPLHNNKLARYLFNVLLQKEAEDNNLYVTTHGSAPHPDRIPNRPTKFRGEVMTNSGEFLTDYYYLEALQYSSNL